MSTLYVGWKADGEVVVGVCGWLMLLLVPMSHFTQFFGRRKKGRPGEEERYPIKDLTCMDSDRMGSVLESGRAMAGDAIYLGQVSTHLQNVYTTCHLSVLHTLRLVQYYY